VSRRARELARIARAAGWRVEPTRGGHLRFRHPDARGAVITASTPGGGRWRHNALASLRRALRARNRPGAPT
jgi:HicA toxin of bacterial toxin-antitoxin,